MKETISSVDFFTENTVYSL